jgi:hypothetical protein
MTNGLTETEAFNHLEKSEIEDYDSLVAAKK